ncbi:MAG TPA: NACHT domain-containing protein, partial [Streptomyces sp.]
RRMVISGAGGSGKTVLAVDLLLALLDQRADGDAVPVRFSLPDWDTRVPLERWLAGKLADDYRVPRGQAAQLVRQQRIVPVLDGLDEMWSDDGGAQRAIAAVAEMNRLRIGKQSAPLVVTCRQEFLDELANDHGIRLLDVATVSVRRLTAVQVADYLGRRFADPARWHGVLDRLVTEPQGVLAQALSTPWRLTLAATAYSQEADGSPDELLTETTDEGVRQHLLTRFVDVTTRVNPRLNRSHVSYYDPAAVRRWLVFLAAHLDRTAGREVGGRRFSGSDIRLHELWPIVGVKTVERVQAVFDAGVLLAVCYVSFRVLRLPTPGWAFGVAYVALYGPALVIQEAVPAFPQQFSWRYTRGVLGLRTTLAMSAAVGAVVFGALWLTGNHYGYFLTVGARPAGLDFVMACLIAGLMAGLFTPLVFSAVRNWEEGPVGVDPTLPIRQELRGSILFGGACGVAAGALVRLPGAFPRHLTTVSKQFQVARARDNVSHSHFRPVSLWIDKHAIRFLDHWAVPHFARMPHGFPARWPDLWLWFTVVGLAAGYGIAALSRRYLAMLVAAVGRLPLGLASFLTWCHSAGLLRTAGTAFQFRHREL